MAITQKPVSPIYANGVMRKASLLRSTPRERCFGDHCPDRQAGAARKCLIALAARWFFVFSD